MDLARCRAALRAGSRTFWAASLLLPKSVRDPATALYAFCRSADDAVDMGGGRAALEDLWQRLELAYAGRPRPTPVDRAFAHMVHSFALPRELPEALIEGIGWDAEGRTIETLSDLRAYAARVAGTVGAMMAVLMGVRDADAVARACDLGTAMQFSNIARDVGEDARLGRLYLPRDWMREAGIDPDGWLAHPTPSPALTGVVRRLLADADRLYERAEGGISALPMACRPGIAAARVLYAEIGREVERLGPAALHTRAVVPGTRKLQLLSKALAVAGLPAATALAPPQDEAMFLVDAVVRATPVPVGGPAEPSAAWWNLERRLVRVLTVFDRLERWEKAGRPGERAGRIPEPRPIHRRVGRGQMERA